MERQIKRMVTVLGPPTLFITLSSADVYWDDVMYQIQKRMGVPDNLIKKSKDMTQEERNRLIMKNQVFASLHFVDRFKAFMKHVMSKKVCD
jgi:response regulator RpfG family c-di-GMP phosphodiesterase